MGVAVVATHQIHMINRKWLKVIKTFNKQSVNRQFQQKILHINRQYYPRLSTDILVIKLHVK